MSKGTTGEADVIRLRQNIQDPLRQGVLEAVQTVCSKKSSERLRKALKREDIPAIARRALKEAHLNYPVPRYMSQRQGEELLNRMLASRVSGQ